MKKIISKTFKFVIRFFIGIMILSGAANYIASKAPKESDDVQKTTVVKVIDGDTIVVDLDGNDQTVRLIGIDTPESVNPDQSKNNVYGEYASDHTKSLIKSGDIVYLSKDQSDTDKYGRLLRYVWLEKVEDMSDVTDFKMYCLNAIIVLDGYAIAKPYEPDVLHEVALDAAMQYSISHNEGLWQYDGYHELVGK